MSKSIRIKDYLYDQIELLASENRRPLISQLELLLEQAMSIDGRLAEGGTSAPGMTTSQPEGVGRISQDAGGPKAQPAAPPSASRPSPEECGMSNRHRMNSKLKPCPRCGYPT